MRNSTSTARSIGLAKGPALKISRSAEVIPVGKARVASPSVDLYQKLFSHSPMPMWIVSRETLRFLDVNEAMVENYGYTRKELLSMTVRDLRPIADIPQLNSAVASRKKEGFLNFGVAEHVKKDGEMLFVEISSYAIDHEGQEALLILGKDVTAMHTAAELLEKSEKQNHRILESITDGVCTVDFDYTVLYWNSAAEDIMDLPRQRIVGQNLWDVFTDETAVEFKKQYDRAMQQHRSIRFTTEFKPLGLWMEITADPSETGLSIYFRNITEMKLSMDRIKRANEQFEMIANATNDTIYEWNLSDNLVYWGKGYHALFGHPWSPTGLPLSSWRNNLPDEDRERLIEVTQQAFREGRTSMQRELRFRCADGTFKTVFDKLVIQYNEEGKPVRLMGAMQDITERKNQESAIVALNEQLQKKADELAVSNRELARLQRCMTDATIRGQEQERKQLGEELHDNINQILATAKLYLDHAISTNNLESGLVSQCKDLIGLATQEIRNLSHALLPPSLEHLGIRKALTELVDRMDTANVFQIHTQFDKIDETALQTDQKLTIYRIAQEQLNNIVKHAGATQVWMTLNHSPGGQGIQLSIRDNGRGFNTKARKNGVGLRNITSRVEHFFGKVRIISSPNAGCELRINFPLGVRNHPLECPEN